MVLESVTPEKPEKPQSLSEGERRNRRLDTQTDPSRPGFQYPGSALARSDTSAHRDMETAGQRAKRQAEEKRTARVNKQKRLRDVRKSLRDVNGLLIKKVEDKSTGAFVFETPVGSEERADYERERDNLRRERDELEGKKTKQKTSEEGFTPGKKYISPATGKTHIYLGDGQFGPALD